MNRLRLQVQQPNADPGNFEIDYDPQNFDNFKTQIERKVNRFLPHGYRLDYGV